MLGFLSRRIAGRVVRRLTGEDREPVGMVSDSDFRLAERFLIFSAGVCSAVVAGMLILTFYMVPQC